MYLQNPCQVANFTTSSLTILKTITYALIKSAGNYALIAILKDRKSVV